MTELTDWDTIRCLLEWLKSKTLETWNNSEDVEQEEPWFIPEGNVKWYSYFGRLFGSILQNYIYLFHVIQQRSWNLMSAQNPEYRCLSVQFSSVVQSCPNLWDPWTTAYQASLSITNSRNPPKPMSIESVMLSNHLILCHPLLLLPSIFPSIRVFPNESALYIRWPKYWSFSFNISPSNEHSGLISFRMNH